MQIQDLTKAAVANAAASKALTASIDAAVAKIGTPADQAAIDQAVADLSAATQSLGTAKAKLDAAVNPTL